MITRIALAASAFLLPQACLAQAAAPTGFPPVEAGFPNGVKAIPDLTYQTISGYRPLKLDLYLPPQKDGRPHPTVVFVHGGGFISGHPRMLGAYPEFATRLATLAAKGYVVASISYRFAREAPFPAQVQDAKAAIAWLRANASTYGIDPTRIAIWGSSAGGMIAATVGTTCGVAEFEPTIDGKPPEKGTTCVQAVADWFGPMTLGSDDPAAPVDPLASLYYGCASGKCAPGVRTRANPITYIDPSDPPFLIAHGDSDKLVDIAQSRQFDSRLRAACVSSQFEVLAGADHGFRAVDPKNQAGILDRAMEILYAFLQRTIGGGAVADPTRPAQ